MTVNGLHVSFSQSQRVFSLIKPSLGDLAMPRTHSLINQIPGRGLLSVPSPLPSPCLLVLGQTGAWTRPDTLGGFLVFSGLSLAGL